jgi:hypothetical protein
MEDKQFNEDPSETERNARMSFKRICNYLLGNHKAAKYQNVEQDFVQSNGMQYESENPIWSHTWILTRKSRRNQWRTQWKISPRHYGYGKVVPRQVNLKYVGRLLLNNKQRCTWRQIPASHTSMSLHFIGEFLPVSLIRNVLFCKYNFLCIFETLPDRNVLYTYLTSA